jgi:hypothetical protein
MRDHGTLVERTISFHAACKREEVGVRYAATMRWAVFRAVPPILFPKDH